MNAQHEFGPIYNNEYQKRCAALRQRFSQRPVVNRVFFEDDIESDLMKLFLIYWSVGSAGLSEPIEEYLRRASRNSTSLKLPALAKFYMDHANEEQDHDDWASEDVTRLVERWNVEHPTFQLRAQPLLENRRFPSVQRYHALHEHYIEGEHPWGELAIDLEIELLAVEYGKKFMSACIRAMGDDAMSYLSFLREHVQADEGHTQENFEFLHAFLAERPDTLDTLVEAAAGALRAYGEFMDDAMSLAQLKYSEMKHAHSELAPAQSAHEA